MPNPTSNTNYNRRNSHRGRRGRETSAAQRRYNPALLLGALSVVLLICAGAVYYAIYNEGNEADESARDLLNQYNSAAANASLSATVIAETPLATGQSPEPSMLPGEGYEQPDAPEVDPKEALISLPGYDVIGKLTIGAIDVELPVIAKTTTKALRVSVCWYGGAKPGEKGNIIITGHNYKSGAHFGQLDKLKAGDEVILTSPDGNATHYHVYETQVVTPDNVAALDKACGGYTLTLLTCASSGNRRLIVRCRMTEAN